MRYIHHRELCCTECGEPIEGNVFHRVTGEIMCESCYLFRYATAYGKTAYNAAEAAETDPLINVYENVDAYFADRYDEEQSLRQQCRAEAVDF